MSFFARVALIVVLLAAPAEAKVFNFGVGNRSNRYIKSPVAEAPVRLARFATLNGNVTVYQFVSNNEPERRRRGLLRLIFGR